MVSRKIRPHQKSCGRTSIQAEIVRDTNGTYLTEKLQFSSFLRKRESSDFGLSEALDPRFRGDDELK